jgi:hypothetical protein
MKCQTLEDLAFDVDVLLEQHGAALGLGSPPALNGVTISSARCWTRAPAI